MKKFICLLAALCALLIIGAFAEGGFVFDPSRINENAQSVVILEQKDEEGNVIARASGFAAIEPGLVVTSASFIQTGEAISAVTDSGETIHVSGVLGVNTDSDIAIIALEEKDNLAPLSINPDKQLLRGSDCVAIGAQGETLSVSIGNISNLYEEDDLSLIQFTSPLSVGCAGSPLFDEDGNVAGVIAGFVSDRSGAIQNLNFAVDISEALHLYEVVREDEIAPFSDWAITDIGIKSFNNPELPMEFYIENQTNFSITQIFFGMELAMGNKSRITSEVKPGETVTIQITQEEYESIGFYSVKFKMPKYSKVHYITLQYPISYLLGKTFVISDVTEIYNARNIELEFKAKERYLPQRRHIPEGVLVQFEETIPYNCIRVINDTDKELLDFRTSFSTSDDLITSSSSKLYSGQDAMLFVPQKHLRNTDTFTLTLTLIGNGIHTFNWKIKTEDLLGKTMRIYHGEDGEVTYEIY